MAEATEIKRALVSSGDGFALDMLDAIERKARKDAGYRELLTLWLQEGSTILLRDDLCRPFREGSIIEYYRPSLPLPFQNMWEAIDSARAKFN